MSRPNSPFVLVDGDSFSYESALGEISSDRQKIINKIREQENELKRIDTQRSELERERNQAAERLTEYRVANDIQSHEASDLSGLAPTAHDGSGLVPTAPSDSELLQSDPAPAQAASVSAARVSQLRTGSSPHPLTSLDVSDGEVDDYLAALSPEDLEQLNHDAALEYPDYNAEEDPALKDLKCSISTVVCTDPAVLFDQVYEYDELMRWLRINKTCPNTRRPAEPTDVVRNVRIRDTIENCKAIGIANVAKNRKCFIKTRIFTERLKNQAANRMMAAAEERCELVRRLRDANLVTERVETEVRQCAALKESVDKMNELNTQIESISHEREQCVKRLHAAKKELLETAHVSSTLAVFRRSATPASRCSKCKASAAEAYIASLHRCHRCSKTFCHSCAKNVGASVVPDDAARAEDDAEEGSKDTVYLTIMHDDAVVTPFRISTFHRLCGSCYCVCLRTRLLAERFAPQLRMGLPECDDDLDFYYVLTPDERSFMHCLSGTVPKGLRAELSLTPSAAASTLDSHLHTLVHVVAPAAVKVVRAGFESVVAYMRGTPGNDVPSKPSPRAVE